MDYSHSRPHGGYKSNQMSQHDTNMDILFKLEKRLHTHQWTVVLKTLIVFHRLIKDGSFGFQQVVYSQPGLFCVFKMKNLADGIYGRSMHKFIRKYAIVLEERSKMTREVSILTGTLSNIDEFSVWKTFILDPNIDHQKISVCLLGYLESILNIQVYSNTMDNSVVALAWMFLTQDVRKTVHLLTEIALNCISLNDGSQITTSLLAIFQRYNQALDAAHRLLVSLHQCSPLFKSPKRLQMIPVEKLRHILNEQV